VACHSRHGTRLVDIATRNLGRWLAPLSSGSNMWEFFAMTPEGPARSTSSDKCDHEGLS
jgi:hypothetical protein